MRFNAPYEKLEQLDPTDEQVGALGKVFVLHVLDSQYEEFKSLTFSEWLVKHV